jgi:hypothetical protein
LHGFVVWIVLYIAYENPEEPAGRHDRDGVYVHSRLRQMVLGGTTQSLLKTCPLPLFLSY